MIYFVMNNLNLLYSLRLFFYKTKWYETSLTCILSFNTNNLFPLIENNTTTFIVFTENHSSKRTIILHPKKYSSLKAKPLEEFSYVENQVENLWCNFHIGRKLFNHQHNLTTHFTSMLEPTLSKGKTIFSPEPPN